MQGMELVIAVVLMAIETSTRSLLIGSVAQKEFLRYLS
jgi:hypothetical protein